MTNNSILSPSFLVSTRDCSPDIKKILEGEVEENEDYINKLSREKAIKEKAFMKLKQEVEKRGKKGKKVEGKSYECMLFIIV